MRTMTKHVAGKNVENKGGALSLVSVCQLAGRTARDTVFNPVVEKKKGTRVERHEK